MASYTTTASAVRLILDTTLVDASVTQFVADADLWVSEELASAGLSDARLELIERYLAAALCRTRDLGLKSTTINDTTEAYQVDPDVTDYLTRAASLDPTGAVALAFTRGATNAEPPRARTVLAYVGSGTAVDASTTGRCI